MSAVFALPETGQSAATGAALAPGGWTIDVADGTALHDCGLLVTFLALPASEETKKAVSGQEALTICWVPGGFPVWAVMANPEEVQDMFWRAEVADGKLAARILRTLARDAGQAWLSAYSHSADGRLPLNGASGRPAALAGSL